jgi:cellulose synthase operon protein C
VRILATDGHRWTRIRNLCASVFICGFLANGQTLEQCRTLRHHGQLPEARACFGRFAASADPYLRAEGLWGTEQYKEANDQFRALLKEHPKSAEYRVRWGRLFLERFVPTEAGGLFQEAIQIDKNNASAYLGMALVAAQEYGSKAVEYAEKAAELDPKLAEARELLAYLALEDNDETRAAKEADQALSISPEALDAMAIHATLDALHDKSDSPWMARILKINPVYGEAYSTAGHFFVINRRYPEGIKSYRKALELNPQLWEARAQLGINLMRLGEEGEARAQLEQAYNAKYTSNEVVNSLRLLDS